jgi:CubicO group peptidase (beta-lactamase class C family)
MTTIHGFADTGFGPVADAFRANFDLGDETGAACAVYQHGRLVVDLHAGLADKRTGRVWTDDTLVLGFSVSKGLMALCGYLAHQRGLLDFDAKVSTVWPEFGENGKQETRIRDLFSHRAGLIAVKQNLTIDDVAGWTPVVHAIEQQRPLWRPGTTYAYHALTYGWLTGEVLRRVTGMRPGQLVAEYLTTPIGADAWIGLPDEQEHRVARMEPHPRTIRWRMMTRIEAALGRLPAVRATTLGAAFPVRMVDGSPSDFNSRAVRAMEIPAANAILSARALAKIYAAAVSGIDGPKLLTDASIADALTVRSAGRSWRGTLTPPGVRFSTGFITNGIPYRPLLSDTSFGHDGASGSLGFADAAAEIGFAYLNNQMAGIKDQRASRLSMALRRSVGDR